MITPQEFEQWRKEPYSVIERAFYRVAHDHKGRMRPNAKAAIDSLMTFLGTYGPAGWGLDLEAACRIATRAAKGARTYDDIELRWIDRAEPAGHVHSINEEGSCMAAWGVRRAS